ncbi:MFS transporter [Streptomyces sp. NPDC051104]|uniref:MDR family MFS transporter n=1 Tax=Streptomyces sp. NPDC051104 TaxID=3155044 RepID=UPI00341F00FB
MPDSNSSPSIGMAGLPKPYWVLWSGTLLNRIGTMVQPFFAFYLTGTRGLSPVTAGAIITVFGLGALFSQLIAGWLTDKIGRRATLTIGMLSTAVCMLSLGYSTSLVAIPISMFLLGLAIDIYRPASSALVADLVPSPLRPRAFGLLFWAVNIGFTVGVLTGGSLAANSYLWMFWIDATTCAIFGVLAWFALRETRDQAPPRAAGSFREVLRDRAMVGFTLVTLGYNFVYLQSLVTLPMVMKHGGQSPSAYGVVMAANGVIIVVLQPLVVNFLGRLNHSKVSAIGICLAGTGFGLTILASSVGGFAATVVVWTLGEIAVTTVGSTIAVGMAPPHLRGRYSGLYGFASAVAGLIAPLFGARLLAISSAALWTTCATICLIAATGQMMLASAVERRTTAAQQAAEANAGSAATAA